MVWIKRITVGVAALVVLALDRGPLETAGGSDIVNATAGTPWPGTR